MRELENFPQENYNPNNILVDEEIHNPEIITHEIINPQDINLHDLNVEVKETGGDPNNYLWQMFHKNLSVNLIILLSIIVLIVLEFIYRRSLFKYSLTYEQNLQESLSKDAIELYKFISLLGNGVLIGLGLLFVFFNFPLVKTVVLCICLLFAIYLYDLLKLAFSDPRPFWINTALFQGSCETSYGNPSGHSLISFFFFLSLGYHICMLDKFKDNFTYKFFVYSGAVAISSLIAFSRLALGVHSLDQVFFGSAVGIWLFAVFAYVFKAYDMPLSYYLRFFKDNKYFYFFLFTLLVLFVVPIILYNYTNAEDDVKNYGLFMKKKCKDKDEFQFYNHNSMAESLVILLILGIFLGQYLFWYLIYKDTNASTKDMSYVLTLEETINHWNNYYKEIFKSFENIVKTCGLILLCLSPGIFYYLTPGENNSLKNVFIFKFGLPLFLVGFLAFGPCLYGLINILKKKPDNMTIYA